MSFGVGPSSGAVPTQPVTVFGNLNLTVNLRSGPAATFSMPGKSPAALQTSGLATDVWIYKKGVLWKRTRVLPVDQSWDEDGGSEAVVTSVGYQRLVEARFVNALAPVANGVPLFSGVDQGSIGWQLIQHTQAQTSGSLGITAGAFATGQVRDRTEYKVGDSLGQLLGNLGDVANGMWWGISETKVYTAQLWTGFATRADPIALGTNARTLKRSRGKTFANAVGVSGSSLLTSPVWVVSAGLGTDPRGRWETFDSSHNDVEIQQTVVDYANANLAAGAIPPSVWTIELDPAQYFEGSSNYSEGQFVRVVVPPDAVDELTIPAVSVLCQISEMAFGFDDSGAITVTVAAIEVGP